MKCSILHESRGRMRVHLHCGRMSLHQADVLEYYLKNVPDVLDVTVYDRTQDAVVRYKGSRSAVVAALAAFAFARAEAMDLVPDHTSRALNREFEEKLTMTVCRRAFSKLFLPLPVMAAIAAVKSLKYIKEGLSALLHGKLSVAVLDATAVTVSMVRGDFNTAGSVMFMLRLGEILEEMGLETCGTHGTTAALALLNDAVKKGGVMASNHVGGLSGAFIPVSEDEGMIAAAEKGTLVLDKLEAMTCVCSVGLDMIAVPGDTTASTISAIIADEAAIGMVNSKTTAVRIIPALGKGVGDRVEMGGLLGSAPVMPLHSESSEAFIARGGRIPAPLQSLKN